jgi:two-component system heavy metal sensor histidine kinase CusS
MKHWPLRWKIALYAAGLGIVATIAGACTTWAIMHYWEITAFDRQLGLEAQEVFRDVESLKQDTGATPDALTTKFLPLSLQSRFIEVTNPTGSVLYRSPEMGAAVGDSMDKIHTQKLGPNRVRMGTFRQNGITVRIGANVAEINVIGRDIVLGMIGAIPTVLLVVAIGGRWVARRALAPVERITEAAAEITPQTLQKRLPLPTTNDEIAGLVSVLNHTFDRLQRSLEQSTRFSAEASHHLKTPLAILRAGVEEILTDRETSLKQQDRAAALLEQVHELNSIADNLLLLARADAGQLKLQREEFDLREVMDGVCDDARALAEPHQIAVEADIPAALPLIGDRAAVSLIVQNLVENAVKYNEPGGAICIHAHGVNGNAYVRVLNNGASIPPERAPHIFDRFYRARSDARIPGAGLGLSIACELARASGGDLELVRSDLEWTEFKLTLPRSEQA